VESCSALVEHVDGRWEILYWQNPLLMVKPAAELPAPAPRVIEEALSRLRVTF
jgi:hypothetical protein